MVNRNAARHLLFAVSILLCFFVYMGYRLRGPKAQAEPSIPSASSDFASFTPGDDAFSEPTTSPAPSSLRPQGSASPLPSVISGDDDFSDWVPAAQGDELALAPPSASATSALPVPSHIAMSETAGSTPSSGVITGLIPAPPQEFQPEPPTETTSSLSLPSLPIPGASSMPEDSYSPPAEEPSPYPVFLPPPGGGLKPPAPDGLDQHSYELETPENTMPSGLIPPPAYTEESEPYGQTAAMPVLQDDTPVRPPVSMLPPSAGMSPSSPIPPAASLVPPPQSDPLPPPSTARPSGMPPPTTSPARPGTAEIPSPPPETESRNPVREQTESESLRIYVVRLGDTLSSIAAQELGSVTLADNIFLLNRDVIADPDHLLVGIKIRLPIRDGGYSPAINGDNSAGIGRRPTYGTAQTHTVARGDTLSSIAQRYYGSSSAWRFLYEANKNVVANPNTLAVGTELSIPPYEN